MDKKALRQLAMMKRHELPSLLKAQYDEIIRSQLIRICSSYQSIGIYVSHADEAETQKLIELLLQEGKLVAVPRCRTLESGLHTLDFYRIESLEDCLPSKFDLLEPLPLAENLVDVSQLEVMVTPLIAYDSKKNRIGYGRGYYDSALSQCPGFKVGVAYTLQKVEDFQPESHDIPMDMIVTEQGKL